MLTRSLSLFNVILVLLPSLLSIFTPVDVLAGITPPKVAAPSHLPTTAAAASSQMISNSSMDSRHNSTNLLVSSSSSSLLSSSSAAHVDTSLPSRGKDETARGVGEGQSVVRMDVARDAPRELGVSKTPVEGNSLLRNESIPDVKSDLNMMNPAAFDSSDSHLLNRDRRSIKKDPKKSSNSSAKSNNNNNNNNKSNNNRSSYNKNRNKKDKSEKETRTAGTAFWSEEIQVGCRELRARRYITDGFCTSIKPIREVVCAGHCLPIKDMPWYAEFVKTMAKSKVREWQCVEDSVKRKRVRLLCKNGHPRFYRIRVVKSCKCEKVSNSNSTHSRKRKRQRRKRKRKSRNNRTGRGS